jgi:hypothetical protein
MKLASDENPVLASQLRPVPIYTPGWREASRVRCLAQRHLETIWVLARFELTKVLLWICHPYSTDHLCYLIINTKVCFSIIKYQS